MADILTDPKNPYNLYAPRFGGTSLRLQPELGPSDELVGNSNIIFEGSIGVPYIKSTSNEIRFGSNSLGAGCRFLFASDGSVCNIILNGSVNGSNAVKSHGSGSWTASSSLATQTFSAPGVVAGDHVHITTTTEPTGGATEFLKVVAGTDEFTVHLSGSNAGNEDYAFNYLVLPQSS